MSTHKAVSYCTKRTPLYVDSFRKERGIDGGKVETFAIGMSGGCKTFDGIEAMANLTISGVPKADLHHFIECDAGYLVLSLFNLEED